MTRHRLALFSILVLLAPACVDLDDAPTACASDPSRCEGADTSLGDSEGEDAAKDTRTDTADSRVSDSDVDSRDSVVVPDSLSADSADADTTAIDSAIADTAIADSAVVDSAVADTAVADTAVPDTAVGVDAACTASSYQCAGDILQQCSGGSFATITTCPAGTCSAALGRCTACTPGTLSCSGTQPLKCNALGSAMVANGTPCVAPETCGGGGSVGVCGCTPIATCPSPMNCGSIPNGCGTGTVTCGPATCTGIGASCGGGGAANVCGCTPTWSCTGKCGPVTDSCGGSRDCGGCVAPQSCGGGGVAGVCGGCSAGSLPGPSMQAIAGYCVDRTEVAQHDYSDFLAAKGADVSGQPAVCAFNTSYSPSSSGLCSTRLFDPAGGLPVTCIDWCDAYAYCKWAGKRLCGQIGGGSLAMTDFADPAKSQWGKACTNGGLYTFPYGSTYDGTKCNGVDKGSGDVSPVPVTSCRGVATPYFDIFDMSGNVSEMIDSCSAGTDTAGCHIMGGNYSSPSGELTCGRDIQLGRAQALPYVGFRCCAP